jgi:nickel transport protein
MKTELAPILPCGGIRNTLLAALFFILALAPVQARAHKVTVFAWVEGDTVFTQCKFAGGRYAKGARLEVYNDTGEKLLEGLTDEQGQFTFKPPSPQALRIVLMAGTGHRGEWRVAADEFASAGAADKSKPAAAISPAATAEHDPPPAKNVTLAADELQALVEASLEKKLAPVLRRLEQQAQGPALSDIIGGIGYILGLVGLGAYIHARRLTG